MYVLILSTTFASIFHSKKNWARYGPIWTVFMESTGYSCPNLMKLEIFAADFRRKSSNVKFRENTSGESHSKKNWARYGPICTVFMESTGYSCPNLMKLEIFATDFRRKTFKCQNFPKIRPVRVILGRTERDMVQYGRSSWKLQVILAQIWWNLKFSRQIFGENL